MTYRPSLTLLAVLALGLAGCKKKSTEVTPASSASAVAVSVPVAPTTSSPLPRPPPTGIASAKATGVHCVGTPTGDNITQSHDGKATVWTEEAPSDEPEGPGKYWLCFERDGQQKVLLSTRAGRADAGVEDELNDFTALVFSRDDRVLFFATSAWTVSTAAHGVEVATGKEWFIIDGQIIEELDHGPFKGNLYASHFRLDDQHPIGSPDYTGRGVVQTVVDWKGKKLRRLPDDELARQKVLDGK